MPSSHKDNRQPRPTAADVTKEVLQTVSGAVERVRYGAVLLTIHEGRVVQVDVTERQRFV